MNLDTFFAKFDQLADSPEAIATLRALVLELAFTGQLIAPAGSRVCVPLGSILAEASINGVSKSPTQETHATEILKISAGTSRSDFYVDESDFKHVHLSPEEVTKFRLLPDDLLACRFNGNLHFVGRFSLYRGRSGRTQVNPDKLIRFRVESSKAYPRYVCYAMNSNGARFQIESMCATTAGNIGLSAGKLKTVELPLPSVAEQRRIVAKVDELMALCDRLEAQLTERESRARGIEKAALARFAEAPTPANLELLFHDHIAISPADLRKSILTLAVQGKLVPQDPNDEPSEELIERVRDALPNKKSENPFLEEIEASITEESEYELPYGWAWLPLGHVGIWATGCGFPTQYQGEADREFLFCKVSDMNLPGNEVGIHKTVHTIDAEVMKKIRARANPPGTVVFPKIGGAIATHKRRLVLKPTIIDNNCSGIQPMGLTDDRWLLLYMRNLDLTKYQSGTSVPAVSQGALDPIRIGLPPLAEQRRIVAKVDQLMALVDKLEAQLTASRTTADHLLSALVAELTAA